MTFTPPTPPTPPAPAVRPTPPTPPRIELAPYNKKADEPVDENFSDVTDEPVEETSDESVEETQEPVEELTQENFPVTRTVEDPESMARDFVANGGGALSKRNVDHGDEQNQQPTQVEDTQSDYDRGQDVLRQFREEDARAQQQPQENFQPQPQTVTEQPRTFKPTINYHEGHGGIFWLATIIFVALVSFVVVKKFLFTEKPALTKSDIFADSTDRLEGVRNRVSGVSEKSSPLTKPVTKPAPLSKPVTKPATKSVPKPTSPPAAKPVTKPARPSPKKDDDDKGKHFEIRI